VIDDVAARADVVRGRIAAAGGDLDRVRVVAVTKGFGADHATAALGAGLIDLGENYAAELTAKAAALRAADFRPAAAGGSPRWHFIGRVQRNKVPALVADVAVWQTVDRAEVAAEIARRSPGSVVLVQVNLTDNPLRGGCPLDGVAALVELAQGHGLDVQGVMALGPPGGPEAARAGFRAVRAAADRLGLPERSLGMSADLEVGVEEGSTMVRVGRALFGPRPGRAPRRPRPP